jgi:ABC-type amino acid transport substrate-binding protein
MRRERKSAVMLLSVIALTACANEATPPGPGPGTDIPVVDIGACLNEAGSQASAEPLGVDPLTQLKEPGVLNVGSDNDFPPFEVIEPGADLPTGFDVDLYTEVADRLELEARSTTTDFDGLFTQSIPDGTFDIGVSAITIKESRRATVDFTVPYFQADLSLAVNTAETPDITSIEDLAGLTIGVQNGTTGADCAAVLVEQGKAGEVKGYAGTGQAFQDLEAGRIAAIVNDAPASQGFIERGEDLAVVQIIRTNEQYGFAISKEKPDLRARIDEVLTEIMTDGRYAEIYEKWFHTAPPFDVPIAV